MATSIRKTVSSEKNPIVSNPITSFVNTPPRNFTRYALVIGNSNYKKAGGNLNGNPINDARDITQRLESLDFKVEPIIDATKSEIIKKLDIVSKPAKNSEIFLFFFAGHGIEDEGINYLIPTDATLNRKDDLENQTVPLETVITAIKNSKCKTSLIFPDACRNNPFRSWARGGNPGLAPVDIDFNDLITYYATQPNSVANNGYGRNGVFTEAILKHLKKGIEINFLMRKVAEDVTIKTDKTQSPWSGGNLMNKFVF